MGRGPDPSDATTFHTKSLPAMNVAVVELSWLRSRDYSAVAALKLVGDRHRLTVRQRKAVMRCSCSDVHLRSRHQNQVSDIAGCDVAIDAFNQLIGLERSLAGGPVLIGRDGVMRDIAGVHGSYRSVEQTHQAVVLIQAALASAKSVTWLLDRPVSNSGRLAARLREWAPNDSWTAAVVDSPDRTLKQGTAVVISGDGPILERCERWFNLLPTIVPDTAWVVQLRGTAP